MAGEKGFLLAHLVGKLVAGQHIAGLRGIEPGLCGCLHQHVVAFHGLAVGVTGCQQGFFQGQLLLR